MPPANDSNDHADCLRPSLTAVPQILRQVNSLHHINRLPMLHWKSTSKLAVLQAPAIECCMEVGGGYSNCSPLLQQVRHGLQECRRGHLDVQCAAAPDKTVRQLPAEGRVSPPLRGPNCHNVKVADTEHWSQSRVRARPLEQKTELADLRARMRLLSLKS